MASDDIACVLVKIHGIGKQGPDWSAHFDEMLGQRLATLPPDQQARFQGVAVNWSDLPHAAAAGAPAAVGAPASTANASYALAYAQYTQYLAANEATTTGRTADLGSLINTITKKVIDLKDGSVDVGDHINDVASYVANNGVRLAIMDRLSSALFAARTDHPQAHIILGAHSQGTIIAYDVLRLLGAQLPDLSVWVTMGCPLGWYLNFASWGANELEIQSGMRWLNLYDPQDIVGKALAGIVTWPAPVPEDVNVDNVGHGLDAHDHWNNPAVVEQYFQIIQGYLV
jgi:hypothetical protein